MMSVSVDYWQILRNTSRTFYLSMRRLPAEIGMSLGLAYLMLRVSDYLEDT
ncbi:MAG: phytoene/squalene synthase family protein, partial [Spirochaetaceae bacterium]